MGCSASSPVSVRSPTIDLQTKDYLLQYEEGQHWICDKMQNAKPQRSPKGVAAKDGKIMHEVFEDAAKRHPNVVALRVERKANGMPPTDGKDRDVRFVTWTWKTYLNDSIRAGKAFRALGLEDRDGVCIFGFNSPEWMMSQLGATFAGGITAGIYPSDNEEQVRFKAHHSGSVVACVQEKKQANTFIKLSKAGHLPRLKAIVYWTPNQEGMENFQNADGNTVQVLPWADLKTWAERTTDAQMAEVRSRITPGTCCALVYTSGTTGDPKAVMLSHDNMLFECYTVLHSILQDDVVTSNHIKSLTGPIRLISYLPLSHVAGALVDIIAPVVGAADLHPITVTFARATDLKEGTLKFRLLEVRPSIFLGVPRVWEKIQEGVLAKRNEDPPGACKQMIVDNAKEAGQLYANNRQLGGSGQAAGCHCLWNSLVFSKLKDALGLDHCFFAFSGAAPIQRATVDFFAQLGLLINDVYGMSESSAAVTISTNVAHMSGSCGYALRGTEVAILREEPEGSGKYVRATPCPDSIFNNAGIDEKYQGEICFRGRQIMMGYLANPDLGDEHVETIKKKNSESIDENGWLHSGDKGLVDDRGMFRITGRYKELIITAGGENVAPVPIEDAIKLALGGQGGVVSNVIMIGDHKKYNVCLLTLTTEGATGEKPGTEVLSGGAKNVSASKTVPEALKDKAFSDKITAAITAVNKNGKVCPSNASKIQKFSILPIDFSIETEEFTATLKLKRKIVEKKYAALIDSIYASESKDPYFPYQKE
eukprot:TRINITY_DN66161_c0_g1_i1.p1 TRINITY_DN66161_c0_g1~~TRINITY_DN66161_c0_g1_i1.p1  ORF type:complete len:764 (+),score=360.29 TRINITY_DN66161_c0_g1_i1:80-2371(+)